MPERAWEDEFTLLCERCGYVIEGLDTAGSCPECGKPIAESLPERRVGTAWEQASGLWRLARTAVWTLLHPGLTVESMRFSDRASGSLRRRYTWTACMPVLGVPLVVWITGFDEPEDPDLEGVYVLLGILALLGWPCLVGVLRILIWVETRGLIFFAARRGGRITPTIARSITAHGSVGWVIAGFGGSAGLSASAIAFGRFMNNAAGAAFFWVGVTFLLAGFLFFETFAWLGLRRCRFANRARPPSTMEA